MCIRDRVCTPRQGGRPVRAAAAEVSGEYQAVGREIEPVEEAVCVAAIGRAKHPRRDREVGRVSPASHVNDIVRDLSLIHISEPTRPY